MNIPSSDFALLSKCILLLSSDNGGEVTSAASRISMILKRNKVDWHDLVAAIQNDAQRRPEPPRPAKPEYTGPKPDIRKNTDWHRSKAGNLTRMKEGYSITILYAQNGFLKYAYAIIYGPGGMKCSFSGKTRDFLDTTDLADYIDMNFTEILRNAKWEG